MARSTLDYLLRDMRHPGGGFYAAEDADSLDPASGKKREGWFYVWGEEEVDRVLGGVGGGRAALRSARAGSKASCP